MDKESTANRVPVKALVKVLALAKNTYKENVCRALIKELRPETVGRSNCIARLEARPAVIICGLAFHNKGPRPLIAKDA